MFYFNIKYGNDINLSDKKIQKGIGKNGRRRTKKCKQFYIINIKKTCKRGKTKMKITIELKEMSKEAAQDVLNEIDDKMLPDYDDSIKSMRIEE